MWDLPRPGLEPVSPALAGRLSTTAPPGKPLVGYFCPAKRRVSHPALSYFWRSKRPAFVAQFREQMVPSSKNFFEPNSACLMPVSSSVTHVAPSQEDHILSCLPRELPPFVRQVPFLWAAPLWWSFSEGAVTRKTWNIVPVPLSNKLQFLPFSLWLKALPNFNLSSPLCK